MDRRSAEVQGGDRPPVTKWTTRRTKTVTSNEDMPRQLEPDLERFRDHTDPEVDLEQWSREVAREEEWDDDDEGRQKQIQALQIMSGPSSEHIPPAHLHSTASKRALEEKEQETERGSQKQLQLGEVNPHAASKASANAQSFQTQLNKARRQLADLVQDKGELRQRLAVAISEAGKQSRRVNTIEAAAKKLDKEKAREVERISVVTSEQADINKQQLILKETEISAVRTLLMEKEKQHLAVLRQKEAMSTTALQVLEQTRAAQREVQLAKDGEKNMMQQYRSLQRKLAEQSVAHEEELELARSEARRHRQAMGLMEERHGAAISALLEQVVVLKQRLIGPEYEEKQRQMADRIMHLERECSSLRDTIMEGKTTALNVLKDKEEVEDQARKLREEKSKLLEEGRRIIQERETELAIVMEQLRKVLAAKEDDSMSSITVM